MNIASIMDTLFRRGYLRELKKRLKKVFPGQETGLSERVAAEADALFAANQALVIDTPGASNVKMTAMALATYRVLLANGMERREALSFVKDTLLEPNRRRMQLFSRVTLRLSRDPLALLDGIGRTKEKHAYGKAFIFEHEGDNLETHSITIIKKCLYHDFFVANGAPEMTAIFCAYDDLWGDVMQTGEYGVKFLRPTTIGLGGELCHFEFRRTSKD